MEAIFLVCFFLNVFFCVFFVFDFHAIFIFKLSSSSSSSSHTSQFYIFTSKRNTALPQRNKQRTELGSSWLFIIVFLVSVLLGSLLCSHTHTLNFARTHTHTLKSSKMKKTNFHSFSFQVSMVFFLFFLSFILEKNLNLSVCFNRLPQATTKKK